ncbi:MAG: LacI family transcriptional regulator [Actinobacteria bacterium]|nr:MAG: LacI family transcriptional regulator [Actinomycetota bacterium]
MERFARQPRSTIVDVARHAQVSKTTVSHVLSGKRAVSPGTRERVQRSIDALGYRPSGPARSLRTRKTHMVALILPDITNPFYPVLARGLEEGLEAHGYRAFICSSDGDANRERAYLNEVCDRGVDGIVLDSFHLTVDDVHAATGGRLPTVWIGGLQFDHPGVDSVRSDDEAGAYAGTRHLVERGHRRIAMIDGPVGSGTARRDGYRRALAEAGVAAVPEPPLRADYKRGGAAWWPTAFSGSSRAPRPCSARTISSRSASSTRPGRWGSRSRTIWRWSGSTTSSWRRS